MDPQAPRGQLGRWGASRGPGRLQHVQEQPEGRGLERHQHRPLPLNVYRCVRMNQRALAGSSRGALCLAGLTETVPRSVSVWASWVGVGPQAGRDPTRSCPQPRWATEATASIGPPAPSPRGRVGGSRRGCGEEQESQGGRLARVQGNSVPLSPHGSPQGGPQHPSCDPRWLRFCRAPGDPQSHRSEEGVSHN